MKPTPIPARRILCLALTLCLLLGSGAVLSACSGSSEVPEGYQYATCNGEYFRLFLPTQWTVNTESGVSGGYSSVFGEVAVSMQEVPFTAADIVEPAPDTTPESSGETSDKPADESAVPTEDTVESSAESSTEATVEADMEADSETAAETTAERVVTLTDFFHAHMANIQAMPGYKHEKTSDTTMNASQGGKRAAAKDITYTATITTTHRYRQVLCKVEGRFYIFTASYNVAYYDNMSESQQLELVTMIEEILGNIVFHAVPFDGAKYDKKQPDAEAPAGMKLVSNKDVPYLFFAPESWISVPGSAALQVYASETDRSNVSIIGFVPAEGTGIEEFWQDTQLHCESTLTDFKLLSTTEGETIDGYKTIIYEYTYTIGGVHYHTRQAICVYSLMLVSMTYTALEENYATHLDTVKGMQDAIRFRAPIIG